METRALFLIIFLYWEQFIKSQQLSSLQTLYGGLDSGFYFIKLNIGPIRKLTLMKLSGGDHFLIPCEMLSCMTENRDCELEESNYQDGVFNPVKADMNMSNVECYNLADSEHEASSSSCKTPATYLNTTNKYIILKNLNIYLEKPFFTNTQIFMERELSVSNSFCVEKSDMKGPSAFGSLGLGMQLQNLFPQNNITNVFLCLKEKGGFLGLANDKLDRENLFAMNRFLPLVENDNFELQTNQIMFVFGETVKESIYTTEVGIQSKFDIESRYSYIPLGLYKKLISKFKAVCNRLQADKLGCDSMRTNPENGICYQMDRNRYKEKIYFQRTFPILYLQVSNEQKRSKNYRIFPENYLISEQDEDRICLAFLPHNEDYIQYGFHVLMQKTIYLQEGVVWFLDTLNCGEKDIKALLENKKPNFRNDSSVSMLGILIAFSIIGFLIIFIIVLNVIKKTINRKEKDARIRKYKTEVEVNFKRKEKLDSFLKKSSERAYLQKNKDEIEKKNNLEIERTSKGSPIKIIENCDTLIKYDPVKINQAYPSRKSLHQNSYLEEMDEDNEEEKKNNEIQLPFNNFAKNTYETIEDENGKTLSSKGSFLDSS